MAQEKNSTIGKRTRADSVLGNRMDEYMNYKRVKATSEKWTKVQRIIEKPDTQLFLFEVPKGVSKLYFRVLQFDFGNEIQGFDLSKKLKSADSKG